MIGLSPLALLTSLRFVRGEQWIGELWGFLEIVLLFWKGGNDGLSPLAPLSKGGTMNRSIFTTNRPTKALLTLCSGYEGGLGGG